MRGLLFDKRGISVALTTMVITAGVLAAGIAVLYWTYSWGNVANHQYSQTVTNSQDAIGENLAFEYTTYSNNNNQLTIYIINCGISNNVQIARVYIWDQNHQLIGTFPPAGSISVLMNITTGQPISGNSLNKTHDGYFTVNVNLVSGYYAFRVVTERGRNFDGSFAF